MELPLHDTCHSEIPSNMDSEHSWSSWTLVIVFAAGDDYKESES